MFIGRVEELKLLENRLNMEGTQAILLYGRRRIGKSELILHSTQNRENVVYIECKKSTEINNLESMMEVFSRVFQLPELGFHSVDKFLQYVFAFSEQHPLILILDEYPYLRMAVNGMDSILQVLLDQNRIKSNVKLILSGSFIDVMKNLMDESNPLHRRFDEVIKLDPMDYYDSAKFYPNFSNEDKIRIYTIFGGVPFYNALINDQESVKENVIRLILSKNAILADEATILLSAEINKLANANIVFETIAKGTTQYSDILAKSKIPNSSNLTYILKKLTDMELITKEEPINNRKSKTGIYVIDDPFLLYYFTYVSRNISSLRVMPVNLFYDVFIHDNFESQYVPHLFEKIAKQFLIRKNLAGKIDPPFFKIGKYYYNDRVNKTNGEFDIVTEDQKGYVFYEVKFRNQQISEKMIQDEIREVVDTGLSCYRYGFISKSGFSCNPEPNWTFFTLNDLFTEKW